MIPMLVGKLAAPVLSSVLGGAVQGTSPGGPAQQCNPASMLPSMAQSMLGTLGLNLGKLL
jgi:hypothetical protein